MRRNETEPGWDETVAVAPSDIEGEPVLNEHHAFFVVVRGNNIGVSYPLTGPHTVIGRGAGADLRVNDEGVSRFHCKLTHQPHSVMIEDLGSRNGTYKNGERLVAGLNLLAEGDRVQIGTNCVFRFTFIEEPSVAPEPEATIDALTGALTRRHFMDKLETEVEFALKHNSRLSLLLVHVDQFAELAEAKGPEGFDRLIQDVADRIRENPRPEDIIARIGPGDFALLSNTATPGDMFMYAEGLRKRPVPVPSPETQLLTLSLGAAVIHEIHIETAHDLFVAAGSALHRARSRGGNRTVLCTPDLLREPTRKIKL